MVSYNIGHLAFLNAKRYGISRVFFGGFFIRGHLYTMNVISYAIRFWSKGEMTALFLRHEGFLGAMGAFLKGHPLEVPPAAAARRSEDAAPASLASRFVERYPMGSPFTGGTIEGPAFSTLSEKLSWVEKFVEVPARPALRGPCRRRALECAGGERGAPCRWAQRRQRRRGRSTRRRTACSARSRRRRARWRPRRRTPPRPTPRPAPPSTPPSSSPAARAASRPRARPRAL